MMTIDDGNDPATRLRDDHAHHARHGDQDDPSTSDEHRLDTRSGDSPTMPSMPSMTRTRTSASSPAFDRGEMLARLEREQFDVLVIGGGITGVGVALDAASRGLKTALVERDDFASGTSSKSSKMVHGGLRYLQQGEVRLVYEALRERQRLRKNAPHLVSVLPFMIPILGKPNKDAAGQAASAQTRSVVSRKIARALGSAMWMYDLTGGWRIGKLHRRLRKDAALAHMPTMPADRVLAAYLYYDAGVDDARLVLTVARTAAAHGAVVANGCAVVGFRHRDDDPAAPVNGVTAIADGRKFAIDARVVVNATGVWSDQVQALDGGIDPDTLRPAKGVHITILWAKVRNDIAVIIPVPKDKRSLFVVPWGANGDGTFQHTYVGTTDTDYDGPLDDPQCTADDIAYMLRALNASVTTGITIEDITGSWAGLRPLVKRADSGRTADLSRRHSITRGSHDVITVTGGKLTTYRQMAEDTVDEVLSLLDRPGRHPKCRTRRLTVIGALKSGGSASRQRQIARYGTLAVDVMSIEDSDRTLLEPLVPGLAYLRAEAIYAVRHEMARTLDDVLSRRTRAHLLDRRATVEAAPAVARLIAPELGWDDAEIARQVDSFVASCAAETDAAMLTEDALLASLATQRRPGS
jgi:glycerol-3-phosphate dehydrogenase